MVPASLARGCPAAPPLAAAFLCLQSPAEVLSAVERIPPRDRPQSGNDSGKSTRRNPGRTGSMRMGWSLCRGPASSSVVAEAGPSRSRAHTGEGWPPARGWTPPSLGNSSVVCTWRTPSASCCGSLLPEEELTTPKCPRCWLEIVRTLSWMNKQLLGVRTDTDNGDQQLHLC